MTQCKKLWLSVIVLLCAALAMTAFAACEPEEQGHEHSWSAEWTIDIEPTCTEKGSKSHHCNDVTCNEKSDVTEIDAKGHGELIKNDGVENSCIDAGAEAYWECPDCHKLYSDSEAKNEITAATVIPAAGHGELVHHDQVDKDCEADGTQEYWECPDCHKLYADEACENEIEEPVAIPASHALERRDGVDKDCTTTGAEEYWECSECHKLYSDAKGENEIEEPVAIPASHGTLVHHDQVDKDCEADGTQEYWECPDCHKLYADEECENEIEEPVAIPASHGELAFHAKIDNACDEDGAEAYWQCPDCKKLYSDEACEHEISSIQIIPAAGHGQLVHHEAVVANCLLGGAEEYWECSVCSRFYSDEECTTSIEQAVTVPVDPNNHSTGIRHTAEVAATCTENGKQGYYSCAFCGNLYSDEECTQQILFARTIPATGHDYATDDDWTIDVAATCMENGSKSHHCKNVGCSEKTDVTEVEARGCHGEAQEIATNANDKKTVTSLNNGAALNYTLFKHYVCPDCNKKFSDEDLTKEVTAVYTNSRNGSWLELGTNIVFANSGAYASYVANSNGYYTFTTLDNVSITTIALQSKENSSPYSSNKWNTAAVHYDRFTEHPAPVANTITVYLTKGEILVFKMSNKECSIIVEKDQNTFLEEGENNVEITVANDTLGLDRYTFVPTETKKYSISVPEGLTVAMNDISLISSGDFANFKATAGVAIVFSFSHAVTGEYTVTIGDEILTVMKLDEAMEVSEFPAFGETFSFVLDESIEEGQYILTAIGITKESFYIAINLEGEIVKNGGNIQTQSDWLYYSAPANTSKTVELKGGDIITLINPSNGTVAKIISFTLTKVE